MNAKAFSIILESQSPSLIVCKTRAVAKFPTGNLGWTQLFMWCCVFVWKTAHRKGHSSEATHDCYIFYTQVCLFQTTMPLCKYAKQSNKRWRKKNTTLHRDPRNLYNLLHRSVQQRPHAVAQLSGPQLFVR